MVVGGVFLVGAGSDGLLAIAPITGGPPHMLVGYVGPLLLLSSAVSPDHRWIAATGEDNPRKGQTPIPRKGQARSQRMAAFGRRQEETRRNLSAGERRGFSRVLEAKTLKVASSLRHRHLLLQVVEEVLEEDQVVCVIPAGSFTRTPAHQDSAVRVNVIAAGAENRNSAAIR